MDRETRRDLVPALLAAFLAIFSIGNYWADFDQWEIHWWANTAWTLVSGATAWMCFATAGKLEGNLRSAWRWFGAGSLGWFLGMLVWSYLELVHGQTTPFPALSDLGFLSTPLCVMVGLVYYGQSVPTVSLTLKHLSSLGFILCATVIVTVVILARPLQTVDESWVHLATAASYAILYSAMFVFGLAMFFLHVWTTHRRVIVLLLSGMAVHAYAHTLYAQLVLLDDYEVGNYLDVLWLLGFGLFFWAASEQNRLLKRSGAAAAAVFESHRTSLLEALVPPLALIVITVVLFNFQSDLHRPVLVYLFPAGIGLLMFLLLWEWSNYGMERELRDRIRSSEERLQSLMRNIPGAIYRSNCALADNWSLSYVSDAIYPITGYPVEEFLGGRIRSFAQLIHPDDLPMVERVIREAIHRREPYTLEYRLRHADGSERWIYESGQASFSGTGQARWLDGALFDVTERKQAEKALFESEKKFRTVVETTAGVIVYLLPDGTILEFNPAAEVLYGCKRADVMGRNYIDLFLPEEGRESVKADIRKVLAGTPTRGFENEIVTATGDKRLLAWYVDRTLDAHGEPTGIVAIGHDVSDRKRADEALRESRQMLRLILNSIPVRVFWKDRNSTYLGCNYLLAKDAGLESPEDIVGRNDFQLPWREHAELYRADDAEVIASGVPKFDYEEPQTAPDGRRIWLRTSKVPLTDTSSNVIGVLGTYEDITERKKTERQAAERNLRLRRLSELSLTLAGDPAEVFRDIVRMLGELLDVQVACVSEVRGDTVTFASTYTDGEVTAGGDSSPIAGTPCETVLASGGIQVIHNVAEKYPDAPLLARFNAFTYCGFPSLNSAENVIAITWLLDDKPHEFTDEDRDLLRIFGQRVGAEIERRRHLEAQANAESQMRKLSSAIEQTADIVLISDRDGLVEYVNPAFEQVTGYTFAEVRGRKSGVMRSGKHDQLFYRRLWETILRGDVFQDVVINRKKSGDIYYEEKTITPLKDEQGNITHFISTGKDITERMQIQERLYHLAYHDILTELPNRALFVDRLDHALTRRRDSEDSCMGVLFMDLDRFKNINDTLGHDVGDRMLQVLSERLLASLRESDTVARLAGDEFVILLEDIDSADDVAPICRKILDGLARPFIVEGNELFVTGSIGISLYPFDGMDASTLLRNADIAMYRAKELGRNTYQFYAADMSAKAFERLSLETNLRHALNREEFLLHYQPQISLATNRIIGVEALLRWRHPDFGLVQPGEFIPLLEETGLIIPVGDWVLQTALTQAREWQDAGLDPIRVAINLSSRQFDGMRLKNIILDLVQAIGLQTRWIELEITESLLMNYERLTLEMLQTLSATGIRLSIDDFGTGYSSLSYLKRFPIDTLKIDGSFIRDITTDPDDAAIVQAIIAMATTLKIDVIAEGVETREQLLFLRNQQCTCLQGYLFSKPLPVDEITDLLRRDNDGRMSWHNIEF